MTSPCLPLSTSGDERAAPVELTPVETLVAQIWRDVLDIGPIGKQDNFFDLGGNSLAAVRVFSELRKQLPVQLPLAALFESSSLSGFAALVADSVEVPGQLPPSGPEEPKQPKPASRQRKWSPLVSICAGNPGRQPLFCIHGAGGNVFNFKALSLKLGREQPVYGLQPQGVDGYLPVLENIEAMASQYLDAIRTVHPSGPYRLLGYSAGGVIAFEMAQQLLKAGAQIEWLAMIDTLTPEAAARELSFLKKLWLMRHWSPKFFQERYRDRRAQQRMLAAQVPITDKLTRGEWLPPELVEPHLFCHIVLVQGQYKPAPYTGSIVLFRAADATTRYLHAGPSMGWEKQIEGAIKVIDVPGSHNSIMAEPDIGQLAAALEQELKALDGGPAHLGEPR